MTYADVASNYHHLVEVAQFRRYMTFDFPNRGLDDQALRTKISFVEDDLIDSVNLRGNRITYEGLGQVVEMVTSEKNQYKCRRFDISLIPSIGEIAVRPLLTLLASASLVVLKLEQLEGWTDQAWRLMGQAFTQGTKCQTSLEELYVSNNKQISSLIFVQLLHSVKDYTMLKTIEARNCCLDADISRYVRDAPLRGLDKLRKLNVSHNPLGEGAAALFKWLPRKLTHVDVELISLSRDKCRQCFEALKEHETLEALNLNHNEGLSMWDLGDVLFKNTEAKPQIKTLKIRGCITKSEDSDPHAKFVSLLQQGSLMNVTELDVSSNIICDEFDVFCARVVANSTKLTVFRAQRCDLKEAHCKHFADGVVANTHNVLRTVDWNKNYTQDEGCKHWRTVMKNCRLESLLLMDNEIESRGGETLLMGLWDEGQAQVGKIMQLELGGSSSDPPRGNRIKFEILRDITLLLKSRRDQDEKRRIDEIRGVKVKDEGKMWGGTPNFGTMIKAKMGNKLQSSGVPPPAYEIAVNQTARPATFGAPQPMPLKTDGVAMHATQIHSGFYERPAGFSTAPAPPVLYPSNTQQSLKHFQDTTAGSSQPSGPPFMPGYNGSQQAYGKGQQGIWGSMGQMADGMPAQAFPTQGGTLVYNTGIVQQPGGNPGMMGGMNYGGAQPMINMGPSGPQLNQPMYPQPQPNAQFAPVMQGGVGNPFLPNSVNLGPPVNSNFNVAMNVPQWMRPGW